MTVRRLDPRDFVRQPWKNGGGFTTELAVYPSPQGEREQPFLWRVSIADIERPGPFSDFSGYERTIMLLEGDGMELSFEGRPPVRIDAKHRPFVFDGGWKTSCRLLGGPVRDMNLMVRRGAAAGRIEVLPTGSQIEDETEWTLVHELGGRELAVIRVGRVRT